LAAELTLGGVDSACHPSQVSEMSYSVLVLGHSISGIVAPPRQNDSYLTAKAAIRKKKKKKKKKKPINSVLQTNHCAGLVHKQLCINFALL